MIKIESAEVVGWDAVIRGMRNPMNSWNKSDSGFQFLSPYSKEPEYVIGDNDMKLMRNLCKAGTDHRKFMRMITVYVDITAPLYWWKEHDQYKIGTTTNSCSTMHKIHEKEFTWDDFSCEHLFDEIHGFVKDANGILWCSALTHMETTINTLNAYRYQYLETKDKKYWWQMIQLLPSSYNQKRTVMLNYEVLANMYKSRKNHKLDEWVELCKWIETLPHFKEIVIEGE